jgi:hypothetical protein
VRGAVVLAYARAVGLSYTALILLLCGLYQASAVTANIWLSMWTADPVLNNRSLPDNSSVYRDQNNYYIAIYGGLGVAQSKYDRV